MTTSAAEHLAAAMAAAQRARGIERDRWSAQNAAQLVRAWPYVTDAARSVSRSYGLAAPNRVIERVALIGDALHDTAHRRRWPGPGPTDPDLVPVVTALRAAAAAPPGAPLDAAAAEQRLVSTVWMASDLVAGAANGYAGHLARRFKRLPVDVAATIGDVEDVSRRLLGGTQLAATGLRFVHGQDAPDDGQLIGALAEWDLQAHHGLLSVRSTAVVARVANVQASLVLRLLDRLDDATTADVIPTDATERIRPALAATIEPWVEVKGVASELSFGSTATPPAFDAAGTRLLDLLRVAGPDDRGAIGGLLAGYASTALAIATTSLDLSVDDELRAPARAIARLTRNDRNGVPAVVDPVAIHQGSSISLPFAARELLAQPLSDLAGLSRSAIDATSGLDQLYRSPVAAPVPTDPGERYRLTPMPSEIATGSKWDQTLGR